MGKRKRIYKGKQSLSTKLVRRLRHKSRVVVWLVKGRNKKKKRTNTASTMLKSRQLAVDLCPQASQSDRAHGVRRLQHKY